MLEAGELGQSGIGDLGAIQVQVHQILEPLDVVESGVSDARQLQAQCLQMGQAGELLESGVGDLGVAQTQLDQTVDPRNRTESGIGHLRALQAEIGFLPRNSQSDRPGFNTGFGQGCDTSRLG